MATNVKENEIAKRLRIARDFKQRTCGAPLRSEVFGEPEPAWMKRPEPKPKTEQSVEQRREYARRWQANHKAAIARRRQKEADGTYGIGMVPHRSKGYMRFRAYAEKVVLFDCAIDAAKCRNEFVKHRFPGMAEFRIELDAVWRKFGCQCGKHRRPE